MNMLSHYAFENKNSNNSNSLAARINSNSGNFLTRSAYVKQSIDAISTSNKANNTSTWCSGLHSTTLNDGVIELGNILKRIP